MSEQLFRVRSSAPDLMSKSATYKFEHYCIIYIPYVISLLSCGPVEYSRGGGTWRMLMSGQLLRAKASASDVMTKPKYFCFTYTIHGFSVRLQLYGTHSWLGHVAAADVWTKHQHPARWPDLLHINSDTIVSCTPYVISPLYLCWPCGIQSWTCEQLFRAGASAPGVMTKSESKCYFFIIPYVTSLLCYNHEKAFVV